MEKKNGHLTRCQQQLSQNSEERISLFRVGSRRVTIEALSSYTYNIYVSYKADHLEDMLYMVTSRQGMKKARIR